MKTLTNKEYQLLHDQAKWRRENNLVKQGEWLDETTKKDGVFCGCMHGGIAQSGVLVIQQSSRVTGFPLWLSYLTENIFERLSPEDAQVFPEQVFKAFIDNPKVCGISHEDFYNIVRRRVEADRIARLISYTKEEEVLQILKETKRLWIKGGTTEEWSAARIVALSAARIVAWSAAESAAWSVRADAAEAVAWSVRADAAEAVARTANESAYYKLERDSLLYAIGITKL